MTIFHNFFVRRPLVLMVGGALTSAAAVILGFVVSRDTATNWFRASGYYFTFAVVVIWLLALLPPRFDSARLRSVFRQHSVALILAALLTIGAVLTSPPQFRVLTDEANLAGDAMALYDARLGYLPLERLSYFYNFEDLTKGWDKRPLIFPFLIAIAHTLLGYRAANGFVVNAIAGGLTLFVLYLLLHRWFSKIFALSGMLMLAAFPVFIIWVTSQGFEIVNLLFVLLAFLWLDEFLSAPSSRACECLLITLIVLAQIRYESALFLICFAPVILGLMKRAHYEQLPYRVLLFPFLMLPVAWQRRSMTVASFEAPLDAQIFSVKSFVQHLEPAWNFFTGQQSYYGMIPIVFYLALLGGGYGLVWVIRQRRTLSERTAGLILAAGISSVAQVVLILSYHFGDLTLQITLRFGIIFLPLLVYFAIWFLWSVTRGASDWNRHLLIGSAALLLFYWPVASRNDAMRQIPLYREYRTELAFLKQQYPDPNILIISDYPNLFLPYRWGAVAFSYANMHADTILFQWQRHLFQAIIVMQRIQYATGQPEPSTLLSSKFQLQPMFESQLTAEAYLRFSRVINLPSGQGGKQPPL